MADTPENSDYTSIQLRIRSALKGEQPQPLMPFIGNEKAHQPVGLMLNIKDYLQLVDETGRFIRDDKRGAMSQNTKDIIKRLNVPGDKWAKIVNDFGKIFHGPVGHLPEYDQHCQHTLRKRKHFKRCCKYYRR